MNAEIVGVGTEILLGQICNDNAQWVSERLAEIGVDVRNHQAVGDNLEHCCKRHLRQSDRGQRLFGLSCR